MAATRLLGPVLVFVICFTNCNMIKLPSYIKACRRNDPDINACVMKNGQDALEEIAKRGGDRKYGIPSLTPLLVTKMSINQNGLDLTFKEMKLNGIENIILSRASIDFEKRRQVFELTIPRFELFANYIVSGRILVLPIQGTGPANITIPNLKVEIAHDYDLKKGKTGKDHMVTKNPTLVLIGKPDGNIRLDNLFGNKELSENMNLVLNQNSAEVISDVGPAVADAIGLVADQIFNGLTALIPFDEMYL